MWFLWGLLMWIGCHTAINLFLSFLSKYKENKNGIDLYVSIGAGIACAGATILSFAYIESILAIFIGAIIGFCTGVYHYNINKRTREFQQRHFQPRNFSSPNQFSSKKQLTPEIFKEEFNNIILSYGDNAMYILRNKIELKKIINEIMNNYGMSIDDIEDLDDKLDEMVEEISIDMKTEFNVGSKTISKIQSIIENPNTTESFSKGEIVGNIVNLMDARQKLTSTEYKRVKRFLTIMKIATQKYL